MKVRSRPCSPTHSRVHEDGVDVRRTLKIVQSARARDREPVESLLEVAAGKGSVGGVHVDVVAVGVIAELPSAHGREGLARQVLDALPDGREFGVHAIQSE